MNIYFDKETESVLPSSRELDISPSASCNASQMLMKSLMTSYNAGNVQFYENLHRKYFDKAKGAKNDSKVADPPSQLLDMTDDNVASSKTGVDLSRFMAESRLGGESRSRSRSRSRGANSNTNMILGSKISSVNMAGGFSKLKGSSSNHPLTNNEAFNTGKEIEGGLDDDTHLFELTEKSNNTYNMGMSYWN